MARGRGIQSRGACMVGGMHGRGVSGIHTVNQQAVCIILECILVSTFLRSLHWRTTSLRRPLKGDFDVLNYLDFIFSESSFDMCELTVVGQAFLWHQIRCIVAVLFLVGQGKETPQVNTDSGTSFVQPLPLYSHLPSYGEVSCCIPLISIRFAATPLNRRLCLSNVFGKKTCWPLKGDTNVIKILQN